MRKAVLISGACALLAGCTNITGADQGLRVVEYGAGGFIAPITGSAGGVAVHEWGADAAADVLICRRTEEGITLVKRGNVTHDEVAAACGAGVPDVSH